MITLEKALGKNTTIHKNVRITKVSGAYERGTLRIYDYVELDNGVILEKLTVDGDLWEVIDNNFTAGTRTDLYVNGLNILLGGFRYDGRLAFDHSELTQFNPKRDDFILFGFVLIPALLSIYSLFIGAEGFGQVLISFLCVMLFGGLTYMFIHMVMRKIKYRRFFLDMLEQNKKEYNAKRMTELNKERSRV